MSLTVVKKSISLHLFEGELVCQQVKTVATGQQRGSRGESWLEWLHTHRWDHQWDHSLMGTPDGSYPTNIFEYRQIFKAVLEAWAPRLLFKVNLHIWLGKMNVLQVGAPGFLLCAPLGESGHWGAVPGAGHWDSALWLAKWEHLARKQQRANFCAGTT